MRKGKRNNYSGKQFRMNENMERPFVLLIVSIFFSDRVSLHSSRCPEILYVDHASLQLTEVCWPLLPEFWDQRDVPLLPSCTSCIVPRSGSISGNS